MEWKDYIKKLNTYFNAEDFKARLKKTTTKGWIVCGIWSTLYIAFIIWVAWGDWASLCWLLLLPIVMDMFTTQYIPWKWWKKYKPLTKEEEAKGMKNPTANAKQITANIPKKKSGRYSRNERNMVNITLKPSL